MIPLRVIRVTLHGQISHMTSYARRASAKIDTADVHMEAE
jgi:hypothetical protein